jgi:hypothetical protein
LANSAIITKSDAISAGLSHYFTGKPCTNGHVAARYTKKSTCVECAKGRAKAQRLTQPNHAEVQKSYRTKNAAAIAEYKKQWHEENSERLKAAKRAFHAENAAMRCKKSRDYYHANKDAVSARVKAARPKHRARDTALSRTKKARRINATPAWADLAAIKRIYARAAELGFHVDHIIPLRSKLVCGLHVETNLRPLPPVDNMKKHNSFNPADHEWSFSDLALALDSI